MQLQDEIRKYHAKCKLLGIAPLDISIQGDDIVCSLHNKEATKCIIPSFVNCIDDKGFQECDIENIIIPNGVEYIGYSAFSYCYNLREVEIHQQIKGLNDYTFADCIELQKVIIPDNLEKIGDYAFHMCGRLETINIPSGLKHIGSYAFNSCGKLKKVIIPDTITEIKKATFSGCANLQEVQLGKNINTIGTNAFKNCKSLAYLNIPDNIRHIGKGAFSECENLQIIFKGNILKPMQLELGIDQNTREVI